MSMSGCLNRLGVIVVNKSIHFTDLIEDSSSEYSCFGFPNEINIFSKPSIMDSGVPFLIGTTSAILVKLPIATRPYRALEVASFDAMSIIPISNSNLAPGETKELLPLGLDFTCMSSRLLKWFFTS